MLNLHVDDENITHIFFLKFGLFGPKAFLGQTVVGGQETLEVKRWLEQTAVQ